MDPIQLDDLAIFDDVNLEDVKDPIDPTIDPDPEPTPTPEPEPTTPPIEEEVEESPLKSSFEVLKEVGYLDLPEDFEFDGSAEKFQEAIELSDANKYKKVAQDFYQRMPDDFKEVVNYVAAGGTSVKEFLAATNYDLESEDVDELKDSIEGQRAILTQYYKLISKQPDEKIQKQIKRLEEMGELEEEVIDAIDYLKNFKEERQQQMILQAQAESERQAEEARKQVALINTSIDKFEAEADRKTKIKSFFFSPIKEGDRTMTAFDKTIFALKSNPEHLVQLADILLDYDPTNGFNLERYTKKGKTQANKSFKQILEEKVSSKSKLSGNSSVNDQTDWDWSDFNKH